MSDKKGTPFYKRFFDLNEFIKIIAPIMKPIPDSAYPNALLRDGSRKMIAALNMDGHQVTYVTGITVKIGFIESIGTAQLPFNNLCLGQISALPVASFLYRGQVRILRGSDFLPPLERDRVFTCLKSDSGTYSWVEIANGGA